MNVMNFFNIPVSLLLGILLGMVTGYGLYLFFETSYAHKYCVRNSMKVIIILGVAFLLIAVEVILFVLVGAAVDIRYMLKAGIAAVLMILTAPLGAIGMDATYQKLLEKESNL